MLSDQIRYFAAAARHEHLGRAADELDMSQPALSRSILKLEEELGVQLFDRAGRGVRLNSAGKLLLHRVERANAECEDAVRELREQRSASRKTVSIGYFATFGYLQSNALDGVSSLGNVPVANLLLILLGMPLIAAAGGWLLAGRQPPSIAQRPME